EVFASAARDGLVRRRGGDEGIDRTLDHLLVLRRRRLAGRRRVEIDRTGMHFAAERQSCGPRRRLEPQGEYVRIRDRADWRLDHEFIVTMEDDLPTTRLGADDGGREQVAGGALHDVLDQHPVPGACGLPLPACVVEKLDVRDTVLILAIW